jgi:Zinc carboxypeptidase
MKIRSSIAASLRLCGLILLSTLTLAAQVPQPKDVLGFTPGDDRKLASWAKVVEYFQKLDAASDRVMFQEIGKTTMGAPFVYATISSPENLRNLEKYKQINAKLADPRMLGAQPPSAATEKAGQRLIAQGKTIVLITCGVHSNEVGSYLSSMLIAYKLASSNDADIKKILDNTIVLLIPSLNPDGVDIINNWYQKTLGTPYEGTDPPELYHKYVGHDDNRDWYAFTQVETQLTVDKIHNVWHPQIVNDIHQQGANGSRLFLPPYMQPVEPNVPKQIVEGYTELGNYIAADLRKQGFQGITTNSTYDAWTPSRAYSHYHGGVRILSETASCKLATPITVKLEDLRPGEGYDPKKETPNFGPLWKGGEWRIGDITRYMITAAFSLLNNAANDREKWLSRFYEIGKEAVRPRKGNELRGFVLVPHGTYTDEDQGGYGDENDGFIEILTVLGRARVKFNVLQQSRFPMQSIFIPIDQPYGSFAKAVLEKQSYPTLRGANGTPIAPYDVTAHTLPLLYEQDIRPIFGDFQFSEVPLKSGSNVGTPNPFTPNAQNPKTTYIDQEGPSIYRSYIPSIDEGWTRWLFEKDPVQPEIYESINNAKIKANQFLFPSSAGCKHFADGNLQCVNNYKVKSIIFPDQPPNQILNGYAKGTMPDEYVGGVGKEGVENLKKFVEAGGTLVFLNRSSDFAIEQFGLPIRDVTKGLARKDFYIPGSILRTELDLTSPIAKEMPAQSIAWFENGPVFELLAAGYESVPPAVAGGLTSSSTQVQLPPTGGGTDRPAIRIIARYPTDPKAILLSGWALGAEKIAGKAALVELTYGKGKIILFGFRPQYRGQSLATFPLLFNAISQ